MGALEALAYVAGGTVVIILLAWLAGCCRSHKTRPTHEEHLRPPRGEADDRSTPTHQVRSAR
jgi:hypothetical protein